MLEQRDITLLRALPAKLEELRQQNAALEARCEALEQLLVPIAETSPEIELDQVELLEEAPKTPEVAPALEAETPSPPQES